MLNISYEFRKGILFIRLNGELTETTSSQLKNEITDMLEDNGITNVVFNISNLFFIDMVGINNLIDNFEICKKNHGIALLCGANTKIKDMFQSYKEFKENIIDEELNAFGKIVI